MPVIVTASPVKHADKVVVLLPVLHLLAGSADMGAKTSPELPLGAKDTEIVEAIGVGARNRPFITAVS